MQEDIRWKQRFDNFDRAFTLLRTALQSCALDDFSDLEQEGIIQRFEYSFELAWKTMKDYLENSGVVLSPVTPRAVIKEAFAANIIDDGDGWIAMMLHRNQLSHTYDMVTFRQVLVAVKEHYLPILEQLHQWLQQQLKIS